jgi:hypothetical protein
MIIKNLFMKISALNTNGAINSILILRGIALKANSSSFDERIITL